MLTNYTKPISWLRHAVRRLLRHAVRKRIGPILQLSGPARGEGKGEKRGKVIKGKTEGMEKGEGRGR